MVSARPFIIIEFYSIYIVIVGGDVSDNYVDVVKHDDSDLLFTTDHELTWCSYQI